MKLKRYILKNKMLSLFCSGNVLLFIFFIFIFTPIDVFANKLSDLVDKVIPSVVIINTNDTSAVGFIISDDGYIVTNSHVINKNSGISVTLSSTDTVNATLIGDDDILDVALLKIKTTKKLPFLEFNTENIKLGDSIFTIGNPLGVGLSVSDGIISGLNRELKFLNLNNLIQTTAITYKGSSGGPMFNDSGKVIGLMSITHSDSGIGFAIPSSLLIGAIDELKTFGFIKHGWLGVDVKEVKSDVFKSLNSTLKRGVMVVDIAKNSPAEKSGIRLSDIIISYNNKQISTSQELYSIVSSTSVNSEVTLKILRDSKIRDLKVTISEINNENNIDFYISRSINYMDMFIIPLNKEMKNKFKISANVNGLYVLFVKKDGIASKYNISEGDIILSINQETIIDDDSFSLLKKKIIKNKISSIVLLIIDKNNENKIVVIPTN
jgi:serine protease Do